MPASTFLMTNSFMRNDLMRTCMRVITLLTFENMTFLIMSELPLIEVCAPSLLLLIDFPSHESQTSV